MSGDAAQDTGVAVAQTEASLGAEAKGQTKTSDQGEEDEVNDADNDDDDDEDEDGSEDDSEDLDDSDDSDDSDVEIFYETLLQGLDDAQRDLVRARHKALKKEYDDFITKQANDRVADVVEATGLTPLEARIAIECCNGDEVEACARISTETEFLDTVQEIAQAEWVAQQRAEERRQAQLDRERRQREREDKMQERERKVLERERKKQLRLEKKENRERLKAERKAERKAKRAQHALARASGTPVPREKVKIEILDDSCFVAGERPTKRVFTQSTLHKSSRKSEYRKGYRLDGEKRATSLRLGDALKKLEMIKKRKLEEQSQLQAATLASKADQPQSQQQQQVSTSSSTMSDEDDAGTGSATAAGTPEPAETPVEPHDQASQAQQPQKQQQQQPADAVGEGPSNEGDDDTEIEYTEEDLRALKWSEARIKAFVNRKSNPNAYYYRFNRLGEKQATGEWSQKNQKLFMELIKDGVDYRWGILSMKIPGRVGYQCSNFYRKLVAQGKVVDPNYQIDPSGKLKFVRPKGLKRGTAANTKQAAKPKATSTPAATSEEPAADAKASQSTSSSDAAQTAAGTSPSASGSSSEPMAALMAAKDGAAADGDAGTATASLAADKSATSEHKTQATQGQTTASAGTGAAKEGGGDAAAAKAAAKATTVATTKSASSAAGKASTLTSRAARLSVKKAKEALAEKVAKETRLAAEAQRDRNSRSRKRAARARAKRKGKHTDEIFADEVDSSDGEADTGTYGYGGAAHKRRKTAATAAGPSKRVTVDKPQLIPGLKCPMTYEPVYDPALSPYGHVMGYDTWLRVLGREPRNTCPFTKQKLTRRMLIKLNADNIDAYRGKIQSVDTNLNFGPAKVAAGTQS
ncbi:Hypothetical Protein FCC1311_030022 [Hondaea fermentalgiana]|uniref:Myb-like domain-containing protein n=1 Tax=Hondaea fermentalgiana TaxID=2315210 RepID=A0A2R5G709_9STRA|nr:Hypothetical Protein FCC1311_030022 [Hondaea fermentalgiana]|eukprot:GBG26780.1 Hypothetical Protein FCC1311_030022 [Hondaea fermentalgiana]